MVSSVWRQRRGALSFWVRERDRAFGVFRDPQHHRQIFVHGAQVKHELQHAAADAVHRAGDRGQFVLARFQRRRVVAGRGAVVEGARGREAQRAGSHGVSGERRHRPVVLRRCGIAARAALAHHIDAQRRVRQLRADIHVEVPLRQPVHVIRKAFPGPGNAGAQHRLGNVLDALHQLDQPEMVCRPARRKADAAIAHDRRGDAVLRRGRDVLAPGDLAVIMGVDVDKARRDQFALRVDLFLAGCRDLADFGDAAARDRHIGFEQITTLAIGDGAATDHEVWGRGHGVPSRVLVLLTHHPVSPDAVNRRD